MLVSFSVSNYRSFGEEVTLNMVASNKLFGHEHHRVPIGDTGKSLVRSALIYGANAAGKSNLVRAIALAQQLITWNPQDRLPPLETFRFQSVKARRTGPLKPSSFEFRFLIGEQVFIYGFDLAANQIDAEWLALKRGDDEVAVFERQADGTTSVGDAARYLSRWDATLTSTLEVLTKLPLRPHQLFLNRVSSLPVESQGATLGPVLRWLTEDLQVLEAEHRSCHLLERLRKDEAFLRFSEEFLRAVGTGISGLQFQETQRDSSPWEREYLAACAERGEPAHNLFECTGDVDVSASLDDPNKVVIRRLMAKHVTPDEEFLLPFSEESAGTQQLLHFMPVLFSPGEASKVVVIDELDRSLHPLLCREFIRFFNDSCPGASTQLIVTTHEAHLLDQELLRRDEYWFVEKDEKQQSQLVPLSDFNIRNDLQVRKGYLHGRFGGIPNIGALSGLCRFVECRTNEERNAAQEAPARPG